MKIVTTRKRYDDAAKGEPLIVKRKARVVRKGEPHPTKKFGTDEWRRTDPSRDEVTVTDENTGEIQHINNWEYRSGCPVSVNNIVRVQFKDGGLPRGRLRVIVVGVKPLDDDRWEITMLRVGIKQRPIPADDRNFYLAPSAGYTTSASKAMRGGKDGRDLDLAAADPAEATRVNRDIQIRPADTPTPIKKIEAPAEPLTEDEKQERMGNISDALDDIAA
jgi:hypothetical protein